jgi:hypothetical protein
MFIVENRVGRLIETRASSLANVEEVAALAARFREILRRVDGEVCVCADYRELRVLSDEAAECLADWLTAPRSRPLHLAVLCATEPPPRAWRLERALCRLQIRSRRAFRDAFDLVEWLGELLDDGERVRLLDFLGVV